jgi:hypothetical protein
MGILVKIKLKFASNNLLEATNVFTYTAAPSHRRGTRRRALHLNNQHHVTVRIETVLFFNRFFVCLCY